MRRISLLPWAVLGCLSLGAFFLSTLPGTSDVNVWKSWVDGLNTHGVVAGYNRGEGYIVHPPLGLLLLWFTHTIPEHLGISAHTWPEGGITGFGLSLWITFLATTLLVLRLGASVWMAVCFQLSYLLNGVVYGYFDLWGVPVLLLGLHAFSNNKPGPGLAWVLVATLVKWQYFLLLPLFLCYVVRQEWGTVQGPRDSWRKRSLPYLPAVGIVVTVLLVFGPGTIRAFYRGVEQPILSGQALNVGWVLTWAMHLRWPESYGALDGALIDIIRTRDSRVLFVVRGLLALAYGWTLWRFWRMPQCIENTLRCVLAGYIAFFLFNRGGHENHLVPAMVVGGYLAWLAPRWRWTAVVVVVAANLNMFVFYQLDGRDRGRGRILGELDMTLPLAVVYVIVLTVVFGALLWRNVPRDPAAEGVDVCLLPDEGV